jgi:hypothetical protein
VKIISSCPISLAFYSNDCLAFVQAFHLRSLCWKSRVDPAVGRQSQHLHNVHTILVPLRGNMIACILILEVNLGWNRRSGSSITFTCWLRSTRSKLRIAAVTLQQHLVHANPSLQASYRIAHKLYILGFQESNSAELGIFKALHKLRCVRQGTLIEITNKAST